MSVYQSPLDETSLWPTMTIAMLALGDDGNLRMVLEQHSSRDTNKTSLHRDSSSESLLASHTTPDISTGSSTGNAVGIATNEHFRSFMHSDPRYISIDEDRVARSNSYSTADTLGEGTADTWSKECTSFSTDSDEMPPQLCLEGNACEQNRRSLPFLKVLGNNFAALSDEHKHIVREVFINGKLNCNSRNLPEELSTMLPLTATGRLTSIGSLNHPDHCTPCQFWSKRLCSRGALCTFCHVHHENEARAKPSKASRHKRRDRLVTYVQTML